jgi:hypothetical protein
MIREGYNRVAADRRSLERVGSLASDARFPFALNSIAKCQGDTAAFILDIRESCYLVSPTHETKNIVRASHARLYCFDHCSRFQLHGRGSSEARWANDNDNRHRGWCSPVWQGQHFPEHGWYVPESSLHRFYSISERGAVSQSAAVRRKNGVRLWKDQSLSRGTGNHR